MDPLLIDKHALGELLSMGPDSARAFCERHGVYPINVGLGGKVVLRWNREEVIQMVSTLQAVGQEKKVVLRKNPRCSVIGKSSRTLFLELSNSLQ